MILKHENIRKIATGQGDDYKTGCLLDYPYFKENYKMIAIDLSKQQAPDADPRAIQQINFTANLDGAGNTTMFFIIEEAKETLLDFSQGIVKVLYMCYRIIWFLSMKNDSIRKSLNVQLSNSQINKLKSAIKNETEIVLRL